MLAAGKTALIVTCGLAYAANERPENIAGTRPGWEIGVQLSNYRYEEADPGVSIRGPRVGLTAAYTKTRAEKWFVRFDGRAAFGSLEYEGSGTLDSNPDWVLEARGCLGRDFFPSPGVSLSPYAGLGSRYLYSDLRGLTSTGAVGYRRYSTYFYAPLGLMSRFSLSGKWSISPTLEYDHFISGKQQTRLTDASSGLLDADNKQGSGYGYRLSVTVEKDSWALGPWMHYWSIDDSDVVLGGKEPKNETREYGIELRYRF